MTYQEQLETQEWKQKREKIITRDQSACTKCGAKRGDTLNFNKKFGIKSYSEMIALGQEIVKYDNDKIKVGKKGLLLPTRLLIVDSYFSVNQLSFAIQWIPPKNKFEFGRFELVGFQKELIFDKRFFDLNVHHKYYKKGNLAWDYEDDALITLCVDCHKLEHEQNVIPIFDNHRNLVGKSTTCDRCYGMGILKEYHYYLGGVCFKCFGRGDVDNDTLNTDLEF